MFSVYQKKILQPLLAGSLREAKVRCPYEHLAKLPALYINAVTHNKITHYTPHASKHAYIRRVIY